MAGLSNDSLLDILRRLDAKDLLRFRCISKSFCSSIDDPYFSKLHLPHSLETNNNLYFIFGGRQHCFVDILSHETVQLSPPQGFNQRDCQILGCCNGLVALRNDLDEILLWNPTTGRFRMLQSPLTEMEFPARGFLWTLTVFGFGYDTISDDYKMIRIIQFHANSNRCIGSEVKVYSLKSNSWKNINGLPFNLYGRSCGVLANNALHWLVSENNESKTMLALDLGTEQYRIFELPGCLDEGFDVTVKAIGGRIFLVTNHWELSTVDLWMLKGYGIKESWTRLISIKRSEYVPAYQMVSPLAVLENGDKILFHVDNKKVFWYDRRTKTIDMIRNGRELCEVEMFVQSLVPL